MELVLTDMSKQERMKGAGRKGQLKGIEEDEQVAVARQF